MIYNLLAHKQALLQDEAKQDIITNYEQYYGCLPASLQELQIYDSYLKKFDVEHISLNFPSELDGVFNWILLIQLASASFSTEVDFSLAANGKIEVVLYVEHGGNSITRKLSELSGYLVLRLVQIWVEEQLNLEFFVASDVNEMEAIFAKRGLRLNKFNNLMEKLPYLIPEIETNKSTFKAEELINTESTSLEGTTTIIIPNDLYASIQNIKKIFFQLTAEEVLDDSIVLSILVGGFIDSMMSPNNVNEMTNF
jgi:hypothetical protein